MFQQSWKVPQFIYDDMNERNMKVNIVITQPRRIAAISIANRVCEERGWTPGQFCGYQVVLPHIISCLFSYAPYFRGKYIYISEYISPYESFHSSHCYYRFMILVTNSLYSYIYDTYLDDTSPNIYLLIHCYDRACS